jgi:hypothetical protein
MDRRALTAIWTVLSLAAVYYALNTYLVSQGLNTIFGSPILDSRPIPSAVFGLVVVPFLLIFAGFVGALYAWRHGTHWHERIPTPFLKHLNTASREGKIFQAFVLIIAIGAPIGSVVHFWDKVNCSSCIFDTTNPPKRCPEDAPPPVCNRYLPMVKSIWAFQDSLSSDRYRIGVDSGKDFGGTNGGVTFVPGLYPVFLLILSVLALASTAWFVFLIFHGPLRHPAKSSGVPRTHP